jgi:Methyltransferase TRM13
VTNASMHHILIDRQDFAPQKSRIRHMIARSQQQMSHCTTANKVRVVDGPSCTITGKKDLTVQHNSPGNPHSKSQKRQKKTIINGNTGTTSTNVRDQQFQYSTTTTTTPTTQSSSTIITTATTTTTSTKVSKLPIIQRVVTDIATMDLSKYILLSSSSSSSCCGDDLEDDVNKQDNAPQMVAQGLLPFSGTDTNSKNNTTGTRNNTTIQTTTTTTSTTPTPTTRRPYRRTICLSKHLCGPACDLAIASLGRVQPRELRPSHVVVATCCHYLCTWDSFAGTRFWTTLGLTRHDFEIAVTCSQWASLKQQQEEKKRVVDLETTTVVPSQPPQQQRQQQLSSDTTNPPPQVPFNTWSNGTTSSDGCESRQNMTTQGKNNSSNTGSTNQGGSSSFSNLMERATKAGEALAALQSHPKVSSAISIPSKQFEQTFSRAQKICFGQQLKQLLDLARIASLQSMMIGNEKETSDGYSHVELVRYTTRSVEDRLLVAYND